MNRVDQLKAVFDEDLRVAVSCAIVANGDDGCFDLL